MNEKIIIGKKATRKNIFTNFIAFTFYGLIGGIGTSGILKFLLNLIMEYVQFWVYLPSLLQCLLLFH